VGSVIALLLSQGFTTPSGCFALVLRSRGTALTSHSPWGFVRF
jgi:hypothetical protein